MKRRPVVGVLGSGTNPHRERARPLGRLLARLGVHLLTGGGRGVMATVSEAFHDVSSRRGLVVGILPGAVEDGRYRTYPGYPNAWVEIAIRTHLPLSGVQGTEVLSRNHLNVLSSDALVALPGSHGTSSELHLADRYARPVVAYLQAAEEIPDLPSSVPVEGKLDGVERFLRAVLALPASS